MTNHEKYKQAFDCLTTDAEINLNPASIRRSRTTRVVRRMCYTAACLVMMFAASNGICYAATGKSLVHTIIVMADGSNVEISEDDNSVTFTIEKTGDLSYTTAENGRLYLNLNDETISGRITPIPKEISMCSSQAEPWKATAGQSISSMQRENIFSTR